MEISDSTFQKIRTQVIAKYGNDIDTSVYVRCNESSILYIESLLHILKGGNLDTIFEEDIVARPGIWKEFKVIDEMNNKIDKRGTEIVDEMGRDGVVFVPCPKCGDKTSVDTVQTRSGDEAMTEFYKCLNKKCGFEFKR